VVHFSLAVIGSGSGNVVVPKDPARGPVALIESGAFGGTCINRGCIPSKILVHTADVAFQVRHAADFGLGAELSKVDWPAIRDRTFGRTDREAAAGRRHRAESGTVTLIEGRARFTGPRALAVSDGTELTADQIVLATGARPVIPPPIAGSGVAYHTSDTVMRIDELPASMVIVGGGYIAAEFAHLFASLGVRVTVVDRGPALLDDFDPEISRRFTELARRRWDVRLSAEVTGARRRGGTVEVQTTAGAVAGELLLVAAGRRADTADLDLPAAGVRLRDDGRIEVDAYGRTTAEGIWSLGDASTPYPLKHVANAEARTLRHNLASLGDLRPYPHEWVPSAVFSQPQIAAVGAREQDLGPDRRYVTAVQEYADVAYGWALQDTSGFCKLYADRVTGSLLGAHIMGEDASLLIQPLVQAAATGQSLAGLAANQYWIHPALTEVVENALLKLRL
jgi:mycothione reductase